MNASNEPRVPDSVKGTGFFAPMDIAPGEYNTRSYDQLKQVILEKLEQDWGERCKTKDTDDFEDLFGMDELWGGRCPVCLVYERFDKFWEMFDHDEDTDDL